MELKEMIKIMQHFENGGKVECKLQIDDGNKWTPTSTPSWNWTDLKYRIKEPRQN